MDKYIHKDEFRLRILATNACNRNCSFCLNDFQSKSPARYVSPAAVTDCLSAYGSFMKSIKNTSIATFSGGEPGLHTWLGFMLRHARHHCDVVKVVTNGTALNPEFTRYVDYWHVGVTEKDPQVIDFLQYSKDITVQIVIAEEVSNNLLIGLIYYYRKADIEVKLFTDFFSPKQSYLKDKVDRLITIFGEGVSTRFTGKQINRGSACSGCEKRCVTLKALWLFPDGSSSTCPQGICGKEWSGNWSRTVREAYKAHYYKGEA